MERYDVPVKDFQIWATKCVWESEAEREYICEVPRSEQDKISHSSGEVHELSDEP